MLKVNIEKFAYDQENVLQNLDFTVSQGQHISILGESGCGKSTLLQGIYGLLHLENGEIHWKEKKLLGPNFNLVPGETFIKYFAQDFDLMPFISVADNIAKFLYRNYMKQREASVEELLEVVDLTDFKDTHVKFLSGGQKQRVALARAIAKEPELLLLDEPISHIDNFRRNALR
ncbi:MAG: ATP-binding cassette domain-containing protein, partial [Leeuwenhoekiella sp.]